MIAVSDHRRRITLPRKEPAGAEYQVRTEGKGKIVLIRIEKPNIKPARVQIVTRKGRHAVGKIGRPITREEINAALSEFP